MPTNDLPKSIPSPPGDAGGEGGNGASRPRHTSIPQVSATLSHLVEKAGRRPQRHRVFVKVRDSNAQRGGSGEWQADVDGESGKLCPAIPLQGPSREDIARGLDPFLPLIHPMKFGEIHMDYHGPRIIEFLIVHRVQPPPAGEHEGGVPLPH